jgi:hypothetical protein
MAKDMSRAPEDEKNRRRVLTAHVEGLAAPQLRNMNGDPTLSLADEAGPSTERCGEMSWLNQWRTVGANAHQRERCSVGRTLEANLDRSAWPAAESVRTPRRRPHRVAGPKSPFAILLEDDRTSALEDDEKVVRPGVSVKRKVDAGRNRDDHGGDIAIEGAPEANRPSGKDFPGL